MLPGVGFSEMLLLALAALIIIGPKDSAIMLRKLGQLVGRGRVMAREFQSAFDDIARQSELEDLRKEIEELKRNNAMTEAAKDFDDTARDINESIMREHPNAPAEEGGA